MLIRLVYVGKIMRIRANTKIIKKMMDHYLRMQFDAICVTK